MSSKPTIPPDDRVIPRPPPVTDSVTARKESPLAPFSDMVGRTVVIQKDAESDRSRGFYCATCRAAFTSSDAYLDHCNGRVHQRNLGLSLKVERVDKVDKIKARLALLTQKRQHADRALESTGHFERQLDEAVVASQQKKNDRKARKRAKKEPPSDDVDDELAATMGFRSFA